MGMEVDLASFLTPAGSLLGEVTQRVLEFLSVQDLIQYVASSASSNDNVTTSSAPPEEEAGSPENSGREHPRRVPSARGSRTQADVRTSKAVLTESGGSGSSSSSSSRGPAGSGPPEDELPHRQEKRSSTGAGDEAGGGSRPPTPYRRSSSSATGGYPEEQPEQNEEGGYSSAVGAECLLSGHHNNDGYGELDWIDGPVQQQTEGDPYRHHHRGSGLQVVPALRCHNGGEDTLGESKPGTCTNISGDEGSGGILGTLVGLSLHPLAALGALRGSVVHLLQGVPLLALLRWASGGASAVIGISFRVALLPYDVTKGVVGYVAGSVEAMLSIATEIWNELRHLSLSELAVVISCVVSGNALPDFLLHPLEYSGSRSASSCGGTGRSGAGENSHRVFSRSSRGTTSLESDGDGGFRSGRIRGQSSGASEADSRPGAGPIGSRGAWQRAHSMRRRLDRVNRTASLVSYEERAESAVPKAKAQRVRRRMHYAMSLQCFQATVTVNNGQNAGSGGSDEGDETPSDGRVSAGGGAFMCTPQSFPPTPVSRAHVMTRTSQFSDDILFLARDQLRLGENLKPGVDETTRATADFLRRQQRLAVLDGDNACEGIVLTCGHHRATKVGPSLYSSARAMVPVLRNRYVYFQVSCVREGPFAPSVGVGLSTPEMPLSTLVGAFSNSVGLCSTGQILMSSRWYGAPGEYAMRKSRMSTVGVLVYLDGSRPFRSWDGDMVRALVSFSVDGRLVHVAAGPVPQAAAPASTIAGNFSSQHQHHQHHHTTAGDSLEAPAYPRPTAAEAYTTSSTGRNVGTPGPWEASPQHEGGDDFFSPHPSHWTPVEEEMAPWEVAAAQAACFRGGEAGGVATFGRAAGTAAGGGARASTPGAGLSSAVPEESAALGLALPKDRDLFPTVTIHSAHTEVLCRFCAADLLPVTRDIIGAPPGVPVYALDGSLIPLPR